MAVVRIALFDPRLDEPVVAEVQVTDKELEEARGSSPRLAITGGTDDVCGTVMVPLGALQVLLHGAMQAANAEAARKGPGIILPPGGIIKPH